MLALLLLRISSIIDSTAPPLIEGIGKVRLNGLLQPPDVLDAVIRSLGVMDVVEFIIIFLIFDHIGIRPGRKGESEGHRKGQKLKKVLHNFLIGIKGECKKGFQPLAKPIAEPAQPWQSSKS